MISIHKKTILTSLIYTILISAQLSAFSFDVGPIHWTPPKEIKAIIAPAAAFAAAGGKFTETLKPQWVKDTETAVGGFIGNVVVNVDQFIQRHDPLNKLIPDTEIKLWGDKTLSGKDLKKGIRVATVAGAMAGIVIVNPALASVGAGLLMATAQVSVPFIAGVATYAVTGSLQDTLKVSPLIALGRVLPLNQQLVAGIIGAKTIYESCDELAKRVTDDKEAQETMRKHFYPALKAAQAMRYGDKIRLRSFHGKYPWNQLTVVNPQNPSDKKSMINNNSSVALQLANGRYLSIQQNNMIGTSPSIHLSSAWKLHSLGPAIFVKNPAQAQTRKIKEQALIYNKSLIAFQNNSTGDFLSSNQIGSVATQSQLSAQERWQLEDKTAKDRATATWMGIEAMYSDVGKQMRKQKLKGQKKPAHIAPPQQYRPFEPQFPLGKITPQPYQQFEPQVEKPDGVTPRIKQTQIPLKNIIKNFLRIKPQETQEWVTGLQHHVDTRFSKSHAELTSLEKFITRVKYYKEKRARWFNKRFGNQINEINNIIEIISQIDIPIMVESLNIEIEELPEDGVSEWLNRATFVINKAKTEEDKIALEGFVETTDGYLKDFSDIAREVFGSKLGTLKSLVAKAKTKASIKIKPIIKPISREQTKQPIILDKKRILRRPFPRKPRIKKSLTFIQALEDSEAMLANETIHESKEQKTEWIAKIKFLVNNRVGKLPMDLARFDDLMQNIEENYLSFAMWLDQFNRQEQRILQQLIDDGIQPVDLARVLSNVDRQMKRRKILTDKTAQTQWLNAFEYLVQNMKDQEPELQTRIQKLLDTAQKWKRYPTWYGKFRSTNKRRLNDILNQATSSKKKIVKDKKQPPKKIAVDKKQPKERTKVVPVTNTNFTQIAQELDSNLLKAVQNMDYRSYWLSQIKLLFTDPLSRSESQLEKLKPLYKRIEVFAPEFGKDAEEIQKILNMVTINYEDILNQVRKNIIQAAQNKDAQNTWFKKLEYLTTNKKKQTSNLQAQFEELLNTIASMKKYFPKDAQMELDLLFAESVPEEKIPEFEPAKKQIVIPKQQVSTTVVAKKIAVSAPAPVISKPIAQKPVRTKRDEVKRRFKKIRR